MSLFSSVTRDSVKVDLLTVTAECSLRGLVQSTKWSSELASVLTSIDQPVSSTLSAVFTKDDVFLAEYDVYSLGKSYFDSKEFSRAAHCLKQCKSQLSMFLCYYSRYMETERKRRYKLTEVLNAKTSEKGDSQDLIDLRNDLKQNEDNLDGYGFYLYGIVLKRLQLDNEAIENLECAVQMQPLHWGAWEELASLCKDRQAMKDLKLPKHWMSEFFYAFTELELHLNEEALVRYQDICNAGFSKSAYVKSQIATALYNLRDFDTSVEHFKDLYTKDPYMLEHIDTYSNILYIQDARPELSYLAHHASNIDKYRTESCGVIGNYYSLRGEHEKAVLYFKQSLRLNPEYIAAWTLLGHEYVELKNTSAAIESYRRATEVNKRDYRAWYGLGQTYEILKMPYYSLYYFREAQKLRPNDARMLIALGDTYQSIDKTNEAKKCYMRAIRLGDSEGQATIKLAKLQETCNEIEAEKLYTMYLDRFEHAGHATSEELSRASLFLACYYRNRERYEEAAVYARKGAEYMEGREEAKTLLFEISSQCSKDVTIK